MKINLSRAKAVFSSNKLKNAAVNQFGKLKTKTKKKKANKNNINSDYQTLNKLNFIGEYLNYKDFKDGIFHNDGCYGFCMYANPLTGASEQLAKQLMGLFALRWPQNATLSFMLYASKELKNRLDAWADRRKNAINPLIREMAYARAKYFSKGVNSSLIEDEKLLVRDYRLVVSVTFNGAMTEDNRHEMTVFKKTFYSSMNNLGFNSTEINPDMLLDLADELFNRKEGFRDVSYRHNPYTSLSNQITGPSTRILADKDGFSLNNTIVRGVTIKEYPPQAALAESMDLIGDLLNDNTQVSSQFLYCTNIWFPDTSSLKTTANTKSARAIQNAESPMAKWVPDFKAKADDWREAMKILSDGQGMYYCNQAFYVFSELGSSSYAENDLIDVFRNKGWTVAPLSFVEYPVFLSCLPMQFDNAMYETEKKLGLIKLLPAWNIVNLLLSIGEWPGNSFDSGMLLVGRRGQMTVLDIFKSDGNYNVAIAADSGAGKSFFMNDLIFSYLGLNAKVYMIDVGRSYEKLCELFKGQYISFGKDQEKVCINPFSYLGYGDFEDADDDLRMIRDLVCQAISPSGELSNLERMHIGQAVKYVYMQNGREACFDDVYHELLRSDELVIKNLGVQLQPYSRDGAYSKYFNGKANVEFNNQFIVLELEELNQKKELRGVIMNLLMLRISQDMYLSPKSQLKFCGMDEAWDLMRGGSTTQDFMETGYRRARKYNGSFITITQRVQDYYANEGATACLTNSDWQFMLKQKPESIDQLKDDKKLSLTDFQMEVIKSVKTKKGVYSEIFIKSNGIGTPVRLTVDPYTNLVYTTDPNDFQLIEDFKKQGYEIHEAITKALEFKQRAV